MKGRGDMDAAVSEEYVREETIAEELRDPLVEALTEQAEHLVNLNAMLRKMVDAEKRKNRALRRKLAVERAANR